MESQFANSDVRAAYLAATCQLCKNSKLNYILLQKTYLSYQNQAFIGEHRLQYLKNILNIFCHNTSYLQRAKKKNKCNIKKDSQITYSDVRVGLSAPYT